MTKRITPVDGTGLHTERHLERIQLLIAHNEDGTPRFNDVRMYGFEHLVQGTKVYHQGNRHDQVCVVNHDDLPAEVLAAIQVIYAWGDTLETGKPTPEQAARLERELAESKRVQAETLRKQADADRARNTAAARPVIAPIVLLFLMIGAICGITGCTILSDAQARDIHNNDQEVSYILSSAVISQQQQSDAQALLQLNGQLLGQTLTPGSAPTVLPPAAAPATTSPAVPASK